MNLYLLFKSLHLIAVISWMAGLLYLPRIFVYHVENFEKKETTEVFEIMEKRLYNYIMKPAMLLSWFLGIILVLIIGIDRLLDMTRTAVNVTGDAAISCVVASTEKKINL